MLPEAEVVYRAACSRAAQNATAPQSPGQYSAVTPTNGRVDRLGRPAPVLLRSGLAAYRIREIEADAPRAMASAVTTDRKTEWLPGMPPMSGDRCVRVLVCCGWLPVGWTERACTVVRGRRAIVVPRRPSLESDVLAALLAMGRMPALEFIAGLERICREELSHLRAVRDRLVG